MRRSEAELIEALRTLLLKYIAHNVGCADPQCECEGWDEHKLTVTNALAVIERFEKEKEKDHE